MKVESRPNITIASGVQEVQVLASSFVTVKVLQIYLDILCDPSYAPPIKMSFF